MQEGRERLELNQMDALKKKSKMDGGILIHHAVSDATPNSTRALNRLYGAQPSRNGRVSRRKLTAKLSKKQTAKPRGKGTKQTSRARRVSSKTYKRNEEEKKEEVAKNLVIN